MELLSTQQAAERLGVSERRVRSLIAEGKLVAHRLGRDYAISDEALATVPIYGKRGRPPKPKDGETAEHEGETTAAEKPTKKAKAKAVDKKKAAKLQQAMLADWKQEPTKPTKKGKAK